MTELRESMDAEELTEWMGFVHLKRMLAAGKKPQATLRPKTVEDHIRAFKAIMGG